jgi:hypothetical protein
MTVLAVMAIVVLLGLAVWAATLDDAPPTTSPAGDRAHADTDGHDDVPTGRLAPQPQTDAATPPGRSRPSAVTTSAAPPAQPTDSADRQPSTTPQLIEYAPSGAIVASPVPAFAYAGQGPLPPQATSYKTEYGGDLYRFTFCHVSGVYRAYIRQQPDYRGRPADAHATHRHGPGGAPARWVCIDPEPTNLEDMLVVARWWAECTSYYIRHGGDFADIQQRLVRQRRR